MIEHYFARLRPHLQELVQHIEESSGLEIEIKVDESRAGRHPGEPDPLACEVDESEACLLLPAADNFPEGAVLHELLHMRRFLVEGVPQIVVCEERWNPELESGFAQWDNNLEHLVIVPEELRLLPERRERWVAVIRRVLEQNRSEHVHQADRDFLAIYSMIFARDVLHDDALERRGIERIEAIGAEDRAFAFRDALLQEVSSKESMVRTCVDHFDLDPSLVCLKYLNPRERSSRQVEIR